MSTPPLRLGTRASALARWQAEWVAARLADLQVEVELVPLTTRGDAEQREAVSSIGGVGVFTKELERALLASEIDLAVHSLKDLPTDEVPGLTLAAVPFRESPFDVLVSRRGTLEELPTGAIVGTGSLRRRAQLLHVRPDIEVRDVRGNVDTRLEKLAAGQYDALVLAEAGLARLGRVREITQVLSPPVMLPAIGQGALAIEARSGDERFLAAVSRLDHPVTHAAVRAERALLAALAGGCLAPIGAWACPLAAGPLRLDAVVLSPDGQRRIAACATGDAEHAGELGARVANDLLAAGAAELVELSRRG
jgi:hydroxymethylbilane synthase